MLRISLRGFSTHKFRVILTVISVALGVALMAGTYVLTDTINASYSKLVGSAYAGESVVITPSAPWATTIPRRYRLYRPRCWPK
jgi:putative ABC transport system permease protein